jgi:hypothetical protein
MHQSKMTKEKVTSLAVARGTKEKNAWTAQYALAHALHLASRVSRVFQRAQFRSAGLCWCQVYASQPIELFSCISALCVLALVLFHSCRPCDIVFRLLSPSLRANENCRENKRQ